MLAALLRSIKDSAQNIEEKKSTGAQNRKYAWRVTVKTCKFTKWKTQHSA
jgi:hypothetical protein